ncbi:related to DNA topoisomerase 2-associated protein PAT1 [Saccharomycodes ludwigii]|uniref:Related to DNA topoisomerase 2-associated protein PAT1 n=1 Tax=Saccharomycodes ludwigii TaxID=36035 RepID=A0A376BB83_9ASCO|nr:related to DNA topoisomerase 2-associated protein PAT1 [Saccharomycodes ludwigii]
MTPRDKDFITRFQLSKIVTEDPYNEDFYFQVYKIIQHGETKTNKDLIARAYLEHSGHRLGGRYKRTDVALQRMQSQVEKAVTVAKERPLKSRNHVLDKEGVLGKVSSTLNSNAPRKRLTIPSSPANTVCNTDEVTDMLNKVNIGNGILSNNDNSSSSLGRGSNFGFGSSDNLVSDVNVHSRKMILNLIENVYDEVLELEAQLRNGQKVDTTSLFNLLNSQPTAEEGITTNNTTNTTTTSVTTSPFISLLSYDKGVKIVPRIFNFLNKEQKLQLLFKFFSQLSHLDTIVISSYKTNPHLTSTQIKKIDLFQSIFLKIIVSFLSNSAEFLEVIGLLVCLLKNNNVSYISTSRIGLNLITVLISRAALIKQDNNRTISTQEVSTWNEVYDRLFTSLETKLELVFPPSSYYEGEKEEQSDQAYIWQFLASLALSGKLNHQRIIIDEIRDQIFGTIKKADELGSNGSNSYLRDKLYQDLNLFLNVMGLVARDGEIGELK